MPARLRVILVEDNDADIAIMRRMLVTRFDFDVAKSIQELLEKTRQIDPDVILFDLRLPDGGDHLSDVVRVVKRFFPSAVIVTTGIEDETLAFDTLKAGAQNYLVKGSFDHTRLHRIIQEAYARKLGEIQSLPEKASSMSSSGLLTPEAVAKIATKAIKTELENFRNRIKSDVHETVTTRGQQLLQWVAKNWMRVFITLGLGGVYVGDVGPSTEAQFREVSQLREEAKTTTAQTGDKIKELEAKQSADIRRIENALVETHLAIIRAFIQTQKELRAINHKANFPEEPRELKAAKEYAEDNDIRANLFGIE